MPLTTTPIMLDDIEANRKIAERLRQQSMGASKMGIDALAQMEALAAKGRAEERQKGIDTRAENRLVLEQKNAAADQARKAAAEARAVEEHAANKLVLKRRMENEDADRASGKLVLERKQAADALKAYVAEGLRDAVSPEELSRRAVDNEALGAVGPSDLALEYETQQRAQSEQVNEQARKQREIELKERGGKADIAQGWARIAADKEKAKAEQARLDAKADKAGEPEQLPVAKVSELAASRTTLDAIGGLRRLKRRVNTGQLAGRVQKGAANVREQEDFATFQAMSKLLARQIGKAVEGGRLTDADAKDYQSILFNPESDDIEFMNVLDAVEAMTKAGLDTEVKSLEESKYAVPDTVKGTRKSDAYFGGG